MNMYRKLNRTLTEKRKCIVHTSKFDQIAAHSVFKHRWDNALFNSIGGYPIHRYKSVTIFIHSKSDNVCELSLKHETFTWINHCWTFAVFGSCFRFLSFYLHMLIIERKKRSVNTRNWIHSFHCDKVKRRYHRNWSTKTST